MSAPVTVVIDPQDPPCTCLRGGPHSYTPTSQCPAHAFDEGRRDAHAETLRADRAERALAEAERRLAYVLTMADSWVETWGDGAIRVRIAAEAIRHAARGVAYG